MSFDGSHRHRQRYATAAAVRGANARMPARARAGFAASLTGVLACFLAAGPAISAAAEPSADDLRFFETKVRPILAENCYDCHGSRTSHAALRLDNHSDLLRGADTGKVVIPGEPGQSRLLQAVRHQDGVTAMPKDAPRLDDADIAALEQWIAMGAPWPADYSGSDAAGSPEQHWAYQPVHRPEVPQVDDSRFGSHPVDAFLFQAWQQQGLQPAAPADAETAARRAWYVLTGLAPQPEELEAFVVQPDEQAWSDLVGELLERPQYGERWARHWLDVARYADTMGYLAGDRDNRYPHAFTYRNWLIDAFNRDLPWHEFIRHQLAADQLVERGEADQTDLAALGFLTVGPQLGRVETIDDRIDAVTRGFMGLTVSCARCHDHKTEPVSIEDYYALYAVFTSSEEPDTLPVIGTPEPGPQTEEFERRVAEIQQHLDQQWRDVRAQMREPEIVRGYLELAWQAWQEDWNQEQIGTRSAAQGRFRANAVTVWRDWLKASAEGEAHQPAIALWVEAMRAADDDRLDAWRAERDQPEDELARDLWTRLGAQEAPGRESVAAVLAERLIEASDQAEQSRADDPDAPLEGWQVVASVHDNPLAVPWHEARRFIDRQDREEQNRRQGQMSRLNADHPGAPLRAMVLQDRDRPSNGTVFLRGDPNRPGDQVERRWPEFFGGDPFPEDRSGRLEMAGLIAAPDNPLTARVIVNRVWGHHFGAPLVDSPSDFGVQTPPPPLLPLLDYLADWFVEHDMSLKALHHFLMTSQAFRLAAHGPAANDQIDGANRYHWRANRRRLDFESMRDRLLQASGALDLGETGGRSVRLERPEADRRRSLYAFIDRHDLLPTLRVFDLPSPDQHSPVRFETAGPQQALFFLNSPFVTRQAERLAGDPGLRAAGGLEQRVDWLHRRLFARPAGAEDLELARAFFEASGSAGLWHRQRGSWQPLIAQLAWRSDGTEMLLHEETPPHFVDDHRRWQGGETLGEGAYAYWNIHPGGGHPHSARAVVLRWTADEDQQVRPQGWIRRPSDQGRALKVLVMAGGRTWHRAMVEPGGQIDLADAGPIPVAAGGHLDLVVDSLHHDAFDSFEWSFRLAMGPGHDEQPEGTLVTSLELDYPHPAGPPALARATESPWIDYIQALLSTNEFVFVD